MADQHDADVEDRRQESSDDRAEDADNGVADDSQPMTEREMTGQESRHQSDQDPDQDRVEIEVDGSAVESDNHGSTPFRRRTRRLPGFPDQASLPASSPRLAPSMRLKAG